MREQRGTQKRLLLQGGGRGSARPDAQGILEASTHSPSQQGLKGGSGGHPWISHHYVPPPALLTSASLPTRLPREGGVEITAFVGPSVLTTKITDEESEAQKNEVIYQDFEPGKSGSAWSMKAGRKPLIHWDTELTHCNSQWSYCKYSGDMCVAPDCRVTQRGARGWAGGESTPIHRC